MISNITSTHIGYTYKHRTKVCQARNLCILYYQLHHFFNVFVHCNNTAIKKQPKPYYYRQHYNVRSVFKIPKITVLLKSVSYSLNFF